MPDRAFVTTRVDWRDATVKARVRAGSRDGSLVAGRAILSEANKTVPYDKGTLKNSGRVDASGRGGSIGATVSYNTPYAARLHENPQYNFKGKGRGKWLQLAVQEMAGRVARIIAAEIAKRIRI